MYFNPRSPRGERRVALHFAPWRLSISIHALREESDFHGFPCHSPMIHFNPRSPRGERHGTVVFVYKKTTISIHALREESDNLRFTAE